MKVSETKESTKDYSRAKESNAVHAGETAEEFVERVVIPFATYHPPSLPDDGSKLRAFSGKYVHRIPSKSKLILFLPTGRSPRHLRVPLLLSRSILTSFTPFLSIWASLHLLETLLRKTQHFYSTFLP